MSTFDPKKSREALGFIQHYGFTPGINFFEKSDTVTQVNKGNDEVNVLLSETSDLRHVLMSVCELLKTQEGDREQPINIYIHEKNKEVLCRDVLLLTVLCEVGLPPRERMEIYLDIQSNNLIRERTQNFLDEINKELIQLITEDDRCKSVI